MRSLRLANKVSTYIIEKKTKEAWITGTETDQQGAGIMCDDIRERDMFKKKRKAYQSSEKSLNLKQARSGVAKERNQQHRALLQQY